jgi:carboxymethylenebutenolidase
VVGSYGARDRTLPGAAAKLDRALEAVDVAHDVKEYPDAGHSFLNDHDPADLSRAARLYLTVFARVGGGGYHAPSAQDARRRIVAFFAEHLQAGQPSRE